MSCAHRETTRMIKKDPGLFWALVAIWIALGIFILYPVVRLVGMAFLPDGRFSISALTEAFRDTYTVKALNNSLLLALAVAITGTVLGYLFALLVTRMALPKAMKALLSAITLLPLISPPFTSSISLSLALGPNGYLLKLFLSLIHI